MRVLDGRHVSKIRLENLKHELETLQKKANRKPRLCVIRVGEDPASQIYVGRKIKACQHVGIESEEIHLSESVSQEELEDRIRSLNDNPLVDGILLQLPLPTHLNGARLLQLVSPQKDVDGFHTENLGRLVAQEPGFVACTPLGIIRLLEHYEIPMEGRRAVVVGRSRIVGRPVSLLLDQAGATVTVVHKMTPEPRQITTQADILVVAAGVPHLIQKEDVKPGAVVIDVGIHRLPSGQLTGDVDYENVSPLCEAITPVPGGVGPMTISSLLENCVQAFKNFGLK